MNLMLQPIILHFQLFIYVAYLSRDARLESM